MAPFFVSPGLVSPAVAQTSPPTGAAAEVSAPSADPLVAIPVGAGPGTPRLLRLPHGDLPLVGLRLFVPIDESSVEAGAAWIVARLAERRISEAARRLGADISVRRTPDGIAYAVVGPRTDFDYLAYLLREATSAPRAEFVEDARIELADALDGLLETGPGQVELYLRLRTAAGAPITGTPGSVAGLSAGRVLDLWSRTHRPERMTLLVSGRVETPLLLASLARLGATDPTIPDRPDAAGPSEPAPPNLELIRRFTGRAWSGLDAGDPVVPVLARLAARALREAPGDFEARILVWDAGSGPVLAATGVAFPDRFGSLEAALDGLLVTAAELARGDAFAAAVEEVRREWLLDFGGTLGRIETVGADVDRSTRLDAARVRLDALDALTPDRLVGTIERLSGTAARVTVR